jgi:hypothetical protein
MEAKTMDKNMPTEGSEGVAELTHKVFLQQQAEPFEKKLAEKGAEHWRIVEQLKEIGGWLALPHDVMVEEMTAKIKALKHHLEGVDLEADELQKVIEESRNQEPHGHYCEVHQGVWNHDDGECQEPQRLVCPDCLKK